MIRSRGAECCSIASALGARVGYEDVKQEKRRDGGMGGARRSDAKDEMHSLSLAPSPAPVPIIRILSADLQCHAGHTGVTEVRGIVGCVTQRVVVGLTDVSQRE